MSKTDTELTVEYCETIASEVRLLETNLSGSEYSARRSSPIVELFDTMAEQAGEESSDYQATALDYVNAYGLEIKYLGERLNSTNEWEVTGVKVLRSFGGPNCWITCEANSEVITVDVYWGAEHASKAVRAPSAASQLMELAEL